MTTFPTKAVTIFGSVLIVGGLAVGGAAAPAFAHTPVVTADCDSLTMRFAGYTVVAAQPASGGSPAVAADSTPNTVTVTIDGMAAAPVAFGTTYTSTVALDDQKPHTYTVFLDAHDRGYDYTVSDSTTACPGTVTPPTTMPTTEPTPTPPTVEPTAPPAAEPTAPPATSPPVSTTPPAVPPVSTTPPAAPPVSTPPTTTSAPPAVVTPPVSVPVPTPAAEARELAATGAGSTVPAIAAGSLAVLLGAGLLIMRRSLRA